ncbi:neural cell adhesion molecule 2-like [Centruroides vittatus]|uniref:neural cell adhesion molecule 2-like n=1 Tax=Centruroides vittatus TaxID=120091 RepID=UPI0035108A79
MPCFLPIGLLILIMRLSTAADDAVPDILLSLSAVAGGKVDLPCDIASPMEEDEVYLVLWYKDESTTPIYSVDARKGRLPQARHAASDNLSSRAYFSVISKPSVLEMESLVAEDEGEYRCRVDFRKARTRYSIIYLQIIVPPGIPIIKDHNGEVLQGMIGPYNEGDRLLLICESEGGKPLPSLTWWKSTILLDDTHEVTSPNTVRNELEIAVLKRLDLMAVYICQASNNNISVPTSSSITLEMNFRPLEVRIEGHRRPLSAKKPLELVCMTTGSRPPAVITWRKGDTKLKSVKDKISVGDSVTTSTLILTPTSEDNGKFLYCQADNLVIPGSTIEDNWKLEVHFVPQLTLRLGSKLRHSNIQERNDVYFECNIRANPWVTDIGWKFDNQELHTNLSAGIIVSNQTLVLQRVQRHNRGRYSCTGTNTEGQGESNHVHLRVQFAPVCKPGQKTLYGSLLHSAVRILCEVEADPADVTFRWQFNNTSGNLEALTSRSTGTRSVVNYIPRTEHDFGTLYCRGKNSVGLQTEPCTYTVIPAGVPGMVRNCSINSETEHSFLLHCAEGDDGGLAQHFYMEVREAATDQLRANISADRPSFVARGLPSNTIFQVTVYSGNAKGTSVPVTLRVGTHPTPESQTQKDDVWQLNINPYLWVLIAIVVGLISVALFVVLYMKTRNRHHAIKTASQTMASCKSPSSAPAFPDDGCDVCACTGRGEEKLPVLITGNGMVTTNGERKDGDGGLMFINSNCVGWKKFQTNPDCDLVTKSILNVPIEDKESLDCNVSVSPSSRPPSISSPGTASPEDVPTKTQKCNSRYTSKTSLTDESNATLPLMSSRQTEV